MNKTIIAAITSLSLLSLPASAQELSLDKIGKPDPSRVVPATYHLDPHHSHIGYQINRFGISNYHGLIGGLSGSVVLDPNKLSASSVTVEIPISGLLSTTPALDAHLKTEDFFDAARYPTARFRSRSVVVNGKQARILGDLTLRDVTKPVELAATFTGAAVDPMSGLLTVGFEATGAINRSDFGIEQFVPFVSDAVQLQITAVFEKTE